MGGTPTRIRMCLRLAILPEQGIGWSEYCGNKWVEPRLNGGACLTMDDNRLRRTVIDDIRDDTLYETATYNPMNTTKPSYKDKLANGSGTSIQCRKYLKEITAGSLRQNETVELIESHLFVDPTSAMNRGNSSYNASGMQSGQEFSLFAHKNGELRTIGGTVKAIPENCDIVFPANKLEANRTMLVVQAAESEFIVKGISHSLLLKPRPAPTATYSAATAMEMALAQGRLNWYTGNNPSKDVVSKLIVHGVSVADTILGAKTGISASFASSPVELVISPTPSHARANYFSVIARSGTSVTIKDTHGRAVTPVTTVPLIAGEWNVIYCNPVMLGFSGIQSVTFQGVVADVRISTVSHSAEFISDNMSVYIDDILQNSGRGFIPR